MGSEMCIRDSHNIYANEMPFFNFKITGTLSLLVISPLVGCSPRIIEKTITMEEQKSKCSSATRRYESASDSYSRRLDSSASQFGSTVSTSELNAVAIEAQRLASYSSKVSKTLKSKEFWCEDVKPDSTLYKVRDYVYLSREDAESSIDN